MFTPTSSLVSQSLASRRFDVVCVNVLTDFPYMCRKDLTRERVLSVARWLSD